MAALKCDMDENGWFTRLNSRAHGRGLWKNISKGKTHFQRSISWKVGMGYRIRFWEDLWLEGDPICVQYL